MDELSEDDKLTVARARKIQWFLSQPFRVAQVFTGKEGRHVHLRDTIKGFKEILNGEHDDKPEEAFVMVRPWHSSHCPPHTRARSVTSRRSRPRLKLCSRRLPRTSKRAA